MGWGGRVSHFDPKLCPATHWRCETGPGARQMGLLGEGGGSWEWEESGPELTYMDCGFLVFGACPLSVPQMFWKVVLKRSVCLRYCLGLGWRFKEEPSRWGHECRVLTFQSSNSSVFKCPLSELIEKEEQLTMSSQFWTCVVSKTGLKSVRLLIFDIYWLVW